MTGVQTCALPIYHKLFLQTGYGLEGVLPDALCKRIIDEQITPRFKTGDFDGGLTAGVSAIIAATKGEYKGTGTTVADQHQRSSGHGSVGSGFPIVFIVIVILFVILRSRSRYGGIQYWGGGWSGGGSSGGWSSGGGGFGGGGGGGFSGGGGSSGGGGAGGSW